VVVYLRGRGHRVFSYLDDFVGTGGTARNDHPAAMAYPAWADRYIRALFARLGPALHPTKCDFSGTQSLEILEMVVETGCTLFQFSQEKLRKV
jgi:hypothetical protein